MLIRRTVQFDDTKAHDLTVNLVKERRMRDLAHGLSLDDEAPAQPAQTGAAPMLGEIDLERPQPRVPKRRGPRKLPRPPQSCVSTQPQTGTVAMGATSRRGEREIADQRQKDVWAPRRWGCRAIDRSASLGAGPWGWCIRLGIWCWSATWPSR